MSEDEAFAQAHAPPLLWARHLASRRPMFAPQSLCYRDDKIERREPTRVLKVSEECDLYRGDEFIKRGTSFEDFEGCRLKVGETFVETSEFLRTLDEDAPGASGGRVQGITASLALKPESRSVERAKVKYYYHLLFPHNGISSRIEMREESTCPWCLQECGNDPRGVVAHLTASHGDLRFQSLINQGNLHVLVLPRVLQVEVDEQVWPTIPVCDDAQDAARLLHKPPRRQYYHSVTAVPVGEYNYDSENEIDESWRLDVSNRLLDDFLDVTPPEKQFMKIWNAFIFHNPVRNDKGVPDACLAFANDYKQQLHDLNLHHNFLLHLLHLWDNSLITKAHIRACLDTASHLEAAL